MTRALAQTWAIRRRRGKERIEKALHLLWLFSGLRVVGYALANKFGPFLLIHVLFTVLFLAIMSRAIRRGERPARIWLGGGALLGAVLALKDTIELDAFPQLLVGWPVVLGLLAISIFILDGSRLDFYLREQALHAQYLRQRRQRPSA